MKRNPNLLQFIMDIYLTIFTIFFKIGSSNWPRHVNMGKGVGGVVLIQFLLIEGIMSLAGVLTRNRTEFALSPLTALITYVGLCVPNYYILLQCRLGTKFEQEFSNLKMARRLLLLIGSGAVVLSVVSFFVYFGSQFRKLGVPTAIDR